MATIADRFDKCISELQHGKTVDELSEIKVDIFKDILSLLQEVINKSQHNEYKHKLTELKNVLQYLIKEDKLAFDCQIITAKTFFTCANMLYDTSKLLDTCCELLNSNPEKILDAHNGLKISVRNSESMKVCLCLAMTEVNHFKSSFWLDILSDCEHFEGVVLKLMYRICESVAFKYTASTLLSFRCLVNILKILRTIETPEQLITKKRYLLPDEYVRRTMDIIMSNWENPLNGVREQNELLFAELLCVMDNNSWMWLYLPFCKQSTTEENWLINDILAKQSWYMKSKYFMVSAILNKNKNQVIGDVNLSDIEDGLKFSLENSYLASAGCKLYQTILIKCTLEDWSKLLLPIFTSVLLSQNEKIKENLLNYWLPSTLKLIPTSFKEIFSLAGEEKSKWSIGSLILLMKIARKESIIMWEDCVKEISSISTALIHENEQHFKLIPRLERSFDGKIPSLSVLFEYIWNNVRSDAFALICYDKLTNRPTKQEIALVKKFLIENINYDNARFRHSIVSSLEFLFMRIRDSFVHLTRNKHEEIRFDHVLDFLHWLHRFLLSNLEDGCNFQRKCTSLMIYKNVLMYYSGNSVRSAVRKSNNRAKGYIIKEIALKVNRWNFESIESMEMLMSCIRDQSDLVRKMASEIVSLYFRCDDGSSGFVIKSFEEGLQLCSSKYFYETESGVLLLKTAIILTSAEGSVVTINKDIKFFLSLALEQEKNLRNDILKSVTSGSPLHGVISIIMELLTNKGSPEYNNLGFSEVEVLISLLERTTINFLDVLSSTSSDISEFAPSFAEMGQSIESVAQSSEAFEDIFESDSCQLSSAYQIILNCIWLNLKICCTLASKIVMSELHMTTERCHRLFHIICNVLKRCRHKGAIESAGVAVQNVTEYLIKHKCPELQMIPVKNMENLLDLCYSVDGTVSRRSAGWSIMIHRIVAGDSRVDKPLLHMCVERLLAVATLPSDATSRLYEEGQMVDLPQPRAMHFLCTLVEDSTLRQEMTHHIQEISILCFKNLSSHVWTIRNAALQLFGSLLPKLVGQKKYQSISEDGAVVSYTIPFEEPYLHFRELFALIEKDLDSILGEPNMINHSKLMPSLTLLSHLYVTMFEGFNLEIKTVVSKFHKYLLNLLSSPIYNVRNLAAKTLIAFYSNHKLLVNDISKLMSKISKEKQNQNGTHGLLLLIKYIFAKIANDNKDKLTDYPQPLSKLFINFSDCEIFHPLCVNFSNLNDTLSYSALSLQIELFSIRSHLKTRSEYIDYFFGECQKKINQNKIGFHDWCSANVEDLIVYSTGSEFGRLISKFLNLLWFDSAQHTIESTCIKTLLNLSTKYYNTEYYKNYDIISELINFLNRKEDVEIISPTLKLIKQLLNNNTSYCLGDIELFYSRFLEEYGFRCASYALPIICVGTLKDTPEIVVNNVTNLIYKWSFPEQHNEDLRLSAVESLIALVPYLQSVKNDNIGAMVWKASCNLLQDEDSDVRIAASQFTTVLISCVNEKISPYVALLKMYAFKNMKLLMSEIAALQCLWEILCVDSNECENQNSDNNPFSVGKSNIYKEDIKIITIVYEKLSSLCRKATYRKLLAGIIKRDIKIDVSSSELHDHVTKRKLLYQNKIVSLIHRRSHGKKMY